MDNSLRDSHPAGLEFSNQNATQAHNWSAAKIGSIENWPHSLRSTIELCLQAPIPTLICWGADLLQFYNSAYLQQMAINHPSLGQPAAAYWQPETWNVVQPLLEATLTTGETIYHQSLLIPALRNGYLEEAYFNVSFTPILGEDGSVLGVWHTCIETTLEVLRERRLKTLADIAVCAQESKTVELVCHSVAKTLENHPADIPFALIYLLSADTKQAYLAGTSNVRGNTSIAPEMIDLGEQDNSTVWPLASVVSSGKRKQLDNLTGRFGQLISENSVQLPHQALILPIKLSKQHIIGLLVVGVSAKRDIDQEYQEFFELVAKQISTAIASTQLLELQINKWQVAETNNPYTHLQVADTNHQNQPANLSRILVVDDNASIRDYLQGILGQYYQVEAVADGLAALAAIRQQQPDLIISDVIMPGLDGLQLLREIRADLRTREIPIILLSIRGAVQSRLEGLESGADDYLPKPFSVDEMLARVSTHLKMAQIRREALEREKAARVVSEAASQRLINVLESITDGFFAFDREWRFTYVNKAAEQMMEMARADLIGREFWDVYPQAVGSLFETQTRRAIAQQVAVHFESPSADTDLWHEIHAYPSPDGLSIYWRDITERKRAEAEHAQLLAREQAARKEAEAANRVKDEFLATLSHELRSPLNSILGWAQLLLTRKFETTVVERALRTIERNAKSQTQLIEDLLDVSRIIQGKLHLNVKSLALDSIIETAIYTLRPAAEAKAIKLEFLTSSAVQLIAGDSDRLQQIVWNLVSNAIKFTPQDGYVCVQLEYTDSHAQIKVSDTGKGISRDFLPYVFERFRQADSSTTRTFGGLGLGLAIVRHLVELHGGTVFADSQGEGKGATFTVNLPLLKAQRVLGVASGAWEDLQCSLLDRHNLATLSPCLDGLQVLVVDDEADTRDFLSVALEQCGAKVTAVDSVDRAIAAVKQLKPDVLVSDIGMPGEDGYSLIRQVRDWELKEQQQIFAIALTAYAREEDRKKAILSGFQDHLSKPVEPSDLAQAIAKLAGRG